MNEDDRAPDGAVEALRATSGLSLVVFPEKDLRAALREGRRLADLDAGELNELEDGATGLTVTERIIEREGEPWLVQQTGPAWAEADEASADLCGILFIRLDGSAERHAIGGRSPGPLPENDELRRILDRALARDHSEADGADDDATAEDVAAEDAD